MFFTEDVTVWDFPILVWVSIDQNSTDPWERDARSQSGSPLPDSWLTSQPEVLRA